MSDKLYLLTPAGRMVQGDCFVSSDKDFSTGRPRTTQAGASKIQWYIGLAIAKTDPEFAPFWAQVEQKAVADFPNGLAQLPTFAWKLIDGDAPEHATKEGFPGHYVLRLSTGWQPTVIDTAFQQIADPSTVRKGCYLQVSISVSGNNEPPNGKPGVYLNQLTIMLIGYGSEISNAPPPEQTFANRSALPAGASATPLAPAAGGTIVGAPGQAAVAGTPIGGVPGMPGAVAPAVAGTPVGGVPGMPGAVAPAVAGTPVGGVPGMPGAVAPAVAGTPIGGVPGMPGAVAPAVAGTPIGGVPGMPGAVAPAVAGAPAGYVLGIDPATGQPAYVPDPNAAAAVVPVGGFLQPQ